MSAFSSSLGFAAPTTELESTSYFPDASEIVARSLTYNNDNLSLSNFLLKYEDIHKQFKEKQIPPETNMK